MVPNVGSADRAMRALVSIALLTCAWMAPLAWPVRLVGFAIPGLYVLLSAATGRCLGYRLMGKSTCPASARGAP